MSESVDQSDRVAVVTGDIVGYSDLTKTRREGLSDELRAIYGSLREELADALPYGMAISSGDRWQWLVAPPGSALAAVVAFVAHLRAREVETRAVIGVGSIDFDGGGNLHEADGAAFRASGRTLEGMTEGRHLQCVMPDASAPSAHIAADAIAECIDYIVQTWTQAQARAVAGKAIQLCADRHIANADIGADWTPEPITKQAVGSHLKKAQWPRLERMVERFQQLLSRRSP